eukprot:8457_1
MSTCDSILQCESFRRIKMILDFYQRVNKDCKSRQQEMVQLLTTYIQENKYESLIDDYHHLLTIHLNQNDNNKNKETYKIINESLCNYIECDLNECSQFKRNQRDRENDTTENKNDNKIFYMNLLDNLHSYLVHGYDIGFRINIENNDTYENIDEQKEIDNIEINNDHKMVMFERHFEKKRKTLGELRGNRENVNKFVTEITNKNNENVDDQKQLDTLYSHLSQNKQQHVSPNLNKFMTDNEYDTDAVKIDLNDINNSNIFATIG